MKAKCILFLIFLPVILLAQLNPQSKKITDKFFPDPNIEINTPAFDKKKGFTKYDEMMVFLKEKIANHKDEVKLDFVGESQKGKKIPILFFNRKNDNDKVKVFFQAGLHGNEPASTEGILYLIDQILNNSKYNKLLDRITLAIIPMANIDGYEKNNRFASNGLDLNRDHTKLLAKESKCLKQAYSSFEAGSKCRFSRIYTI
jgi:murein tripeptide amidase MpaA